MSKKEAKEVNSKEEVVVETEETAAEANAVEENTAEDTAEEQIGTKESAEEETVTEESESDMAEEDAIEVNAEIVDEAALAAKALVKAEAALKESQDRYQRTMAEFDNFRKRTTREKAQMHENGAKEVLEKLLPIIDNFERAIDHISDDEKSLAITQGVEMIYKQLMNTLSELGVEEIEALNQEFDPNLHHAVSHEDNEDYDDNMVQDVFQKGYMYKDAVLRYSMVKVVN